MLRYSTAHMLSQWRDESIYQDLTKKKYLTLPLNGCCCLQSNHCSNCICGMAWRELIKMLGGVRTWPPLSPCVYVGLVQCTGCLRNYRKYILYLLTSVLGRLHDLKYIFAVTYETLCTRLIAETSWRCVSIWIIQ